MEYYPLQKNHSIPLYVQLSEIIKKNILENNLREGALIPSESELMRGYGVSRITVRNALLRLEFDGLIFKVHGRGSFVCAKRMVEIPSPAHSFRKQMMEQGINISRQLVEFSDVYPTERLVERLQLKSGQKATKIKRLIKMEETTIGMDSLFLPQEIGLTLQDVDLAKIFLIDHLNEKPETRIYKMEALVRAAAIEDADAETMDVDNNSTVLLRACTYFDRWRRPVMAGKVIYLSQYAAINLVVKAEQNSLRVQVSDVPQGVESLI